jgi:hypothetical protein
MPIWISNNSFTRAHTASRILSMVIGGPYYFSLSRTSRWTDPPPIPLPSDVLIPSELLVYKKAYKVMAAFRNPCGPHLIQGERWSLVNASDVLLQPNGTYIPDITHLYISLLMEEADHRAEYTNILGLHSGLQLTLDANPADIRGLYQNQDAVTYPPSMVTSSGTLHWLAYTSPIYTRPRLSQEVSFLIHYGTN